MSPRAKELVLSGLLAASSLVMWLSLSEFLQSPGKESAAFLASAVVAGFLFTFTYCAAVVLFESRGLFGAAWFLSSSVAFLWVRGAPVFIAVFALIFAGLAGYGRAKRGISKLAGASLAYPLKKSVPLMITALLLLVAVSAYAWTPAGKITLPQILPERYFNVALKFADPIVKIASEDFNRNAKFGDFMARNAEKRLKAQGITLTGSERAAIADNSANEVNKEYDINIKSTDTVSHVLYAVTMKFLGERADAYEKILPMAFAAGIFISARLIAFPFYWAAIILAILFIKLLARLGVVKLKNIQKTVSIYSLS